MSKSRWKRFLPCAALLAALSPAPSVAETPAMEKKTGGAPLEAAQRLLRGVTDRSATD